MRAAVVTELGATPVAGEFEEPVAGSGQAAVEVVLGGLNPVDLMLAGPGGSLRAPAVAGAEGIARLDGRHVYFSSAVKPHGSFAERTLIDPDAVFEVPDGLDPALAVALGIAGLAAWLPLSHHAQVTGGERVLILGASGIAGQIAVQAAKLLGAGHVVAAGRHEQTLAPLRDRAADAIAVLGDDAEGPIAAEAGDGFDVVVDYVFGEPFRAGLAHCASGGTVVIVGAGAGGESTLGFRDLQGKTIVGHGNPSVAFDVRASAFATMAEHVEAGRLGVEVERYPLERVGEAWEAQASSPHRKLVVVPE